MHNDRKTLHLISLGCAKNLVDSEILLGGLKNTQYDVTERPDDADTIIINTCGFLDIAREESVDTILQAAELRKKGVIEQLVVMGCLSERYHNDLKKEIPEVDRFFGTNDHRQIASFITGKDYGKDDPLFFRSILTPSHFAYLKIAEGCDNGCSFCSIPIMRGLQKSRMIPGLISETNRLVDNGTKEIMIIAQDTTSYGWDLDKKVYLSDLIAEMDKIDNVYYYMQYIKFGFGRATRDACRMVQNDQMTREEAIELARKHDDEFPKTNFQDVLNYLDLSQNDFDTIVNKHRNEEIWHIKNNHWELECKI